MQYKKIKNADLIVSSSKYLVKNPYEYQKRWHELFNNSNPICLELGMGRGDFIIDMAKAHPNINYIGLEIVDSQMVMAVNRLSNLNLKTYNKSYIKQLYYNLLFSQLYNIDKFDYILKNNYNYSRNLKIIINYFIIINRLYK